MGGTGALGAEFVEQSMRLHRTTMNINDPVPALLFDQSERTTELVSGLECLVAQAKTELAARGIDIAGFPDMQVVAMAKDERRKAAGHLSQISPKPRPQYLASNAMKKSKTTLGKAQKRRLVPC